MCQFCSSWPVSAYHDAWYIGHVQQIFVDPGSMLIAREMTANGSNSCTSLFSGEVRVLNRPYGCFLTHPLSPQRGPIERVLRSSQSRKVKCEVFAPHAILVLLICEAVHPGSKYTK